MTVMQFYSSVGGDYYDAVGRLRNDRMILKFLKMLANDKSLVKLHEAIDKGDCMEAFCAIHTLKGMALNLSLTELSHFCCSLTELFRGANTIAEESYELVAKLDGIYEHTISLLDELE